MEAAEFARGQDRFDAMHRALFSAFFEHGRDIGDLRVLVEVGAAVGLEGGMLERALESGDHAGKVLADQALARRLGIGGVPAMLIEANGRALLLSGAQPLDAINAAIDRVVSDGAAQGIS